MRINSIWVRFQRFFEVPIAAIASNFHDRIDGCFNSINSAPAHSKTAHFTNMAAQVDWHIVYNAELQIIPATDVQSSIGEPSSVISKCHPNE